MSRLITVYTLNMCECESEVAQLCPTLAAPWTIAYQAPPSMGFSRQEYWSGLPFPSPGNITSYITTAFTLASGIAELEIIKILYYCTRYITVQ